MNSVSARVSLLGAILGVLVGISLPRVGVTQAEPALRDAVQPALRDFAAKGLLGEPGKEGTANTVIARTSYTVDEIIEGAKFKPMYEPSTTGTSTVLYIDQLNAYESVNIEALKPALSE